MLAVSVCLIETWLQLYTVMYMYLCIVEMFCPPVDNALRRSYVFHPSGMKFMKWSNSVGTAELALGKVVPMMPRQARSIRVAIPSVKLRFCSLVRI